MSGRPTRGWRERAALAFADVDVALAGVLYAAPRVTVAMLTILALAMVVPGSGAAPFVVCAAGSAFGATRKERLPTALWIAVGLLAFGPFGGREMPEWVEGHGAPLFVHGAAFVAAALLGQRRLQLEAAVALLAIAVVGAYVPYDQFANLYDPAHEQGWLLAARAATVACGAVGLAALGAARRRGATIFAVMFVVWWGVQLGGHAWRDSNGMAEPFLAFAVGRATAALETGSPGAIDAATGKLAGRAQRHPWLVTLALIPLMAHLVPVRTAVWGVAWHIYELDVGTDQDRLAAITAVEAMPTTLLLTIAFLAHVGRRAVSLFGAAAPWTALAAMTTLAVGASALSGDGGALGTPLVALAGFALPWAALLLGLAAGGRAPGRRRDAIDVGLAAVMAVSGLVLVWIVRVTDPAVAWSKGGSSSIQIASLGATLGWLVLFHRAVSLPMTLAQTLAAGGAIGAVAGLLLTPALAYPAFGIADVGLMSLLGGFGALFVAAARRLHSLTVVPADHPCFDR